jgi:thiamine-monophosphate kinase
MSASNISPEFKLISLLTQSDYPKDKDIALGNGDDAAVISPNVSEVPLKRLAISVDTIVEGTHFLLSLSTPQQIGIKAVEASVSDLIAVGALPKFILVSITLPRASPNIDNSNLCRKIYEGIDDACQRMQLTILGGDTSVGSDSWSVSVTSLGYILSDKRILTRGGAKQGDLIYVTGALGRSAAGFYALKHKLKDPQLSDLIQHHLAPRCRFDLLASELGELATSAIDISDGLSSELHHICRASKVGCLIDEALIPIDAATLYLAQTLTLNPHELAWNGGEDFEILFTCPRHLAARGAPGVCIGEITEEGSGLSVLRRGRLEPILAKGFDHFNC